MNILLDHLNMHLPWGYEYFKNIIREDRKITYLPLAFHEDWIHNAGEWEEWYGKQGSHYNMFTAPFLAFGIKEDNIEYINYFTDTEESAGKKINGSDILVFAGGMPDRIINRLKEMKLTDTIDAYTGIIMGWSAGSMIQCEDYYISPDEDYPEYARYQGLKGLSGFAVEVHYQGEPGQKASIQRYIAETGNKVYVTSGEGAVIVEGDDIKLLGNAREYLDD